MAGAVCIHRVHWSEAGEVLRAIRIEVFVEEQGIDLALEMDDRDAVCRHAVAWVDGLPVGTARLDLDRGGQIGRLAVRRAYRRRGIGSALLTALEAEAVRHGLEHVWLNAQVASLSFYLARGYRPEGPVFDEAGLPHQRMMKTIHPGAVSPRTPGGSPHD